MDHTKCDVFGNPTYQIIGRNVNDQQVVDLDGTSTICPIEGYSFSLDGHLYVLVNIRWNSIECNVTYLVSLLESEITDFIFTLKQMQKDNELEYKICTLHNINEYETVYSGSEFSRDLSHNHFGFSGNRDMVYMYHPRNIKNMSLHRYPVMLNDI